MATHGFLSLLQWPSSRPNAEADERVGAEGNRSRKWPCGSASRPCQLRRLRDGETRSPWAAAGAGVGLSRSRHRPPTPWIIERSPVPSDGRRVAKPAEADGEQHTCGAEVTSCRRTASSGRRKRTRRGRSDEGCDRQYSAW
jgi:hypothetical protein